MLLIIDIICRNTTCFHGYSNDNETTVNMQTIIFRWWIIIAQNIWYCDFYVVTVFAFNGSQLAKLKKVFGSYCCPENRVEAVGLKNSNIIWKLHFFLNCKIWGNFVKNRYFAINCLIKVQIWECFCIYVTHITVIIFHIANIVGTKCNFS